MFSIWEFIKPSITCPLPENTHKLWFFIAYLNLNVLTNLGLWTIHLNDFSLNFSPLESKNSKAKSISEIEPEDDNDANEEQEEVDSDQSSSENANENSMRVSKRRQDQESKDKTLYIVLCYRG